MDVNLPEWLGVIGAVLSIALALGAALALVKGSYNRARIQALREDNDDLRARVGDLDSELERRKLREETMEAKVNKVDSENQLLRELVTQRADVERVEEAVREHHSKALKELDEHHEMSVNAWRQISEALGILIERNKS